MNVIAQFCISLGSLLACCGCSWAGENGGADSQEGKGRMSSYLYPVMYSDGGRSSAIDASSGSRGVVEWAVDLIPQGVDRRLEPRAVLSCNDRLVVQTDRLLIAFDPGGKRLWEREIWPGSTVWAYGGSIYFRKPDELSELGALSLEGEVIDRPMPILDCDESASPLFIEPQADGFLALSVVAVAPEQGASYLKFYRKHFEEKTYDWVGSAKGRAVLPPLHLSRIDRLVVFAANDILVYDSATENMNGQEVTRFPYPMEKLNACSATSDGTLHFSGSTRGKSELIAVGSDGKVGWRCDKLGPAGQISSRQPPILGSDSTAFVTIGNSVTKVRDGEVEWTFSTEGPPISFGTALADKTLLVTAEHVLIRIDSEGREVFRVDLESTILTPPIIDRSGNVYVATADRLVKVS